jgi:uncharacterized phage protein gp47/JayE
MITVPERTTVLAELLASLKASRPQIDSSKGSPEWARANALVELTYGLRWAIREVQYTIWPGPNTPTAELESHAELRLGDDPRLKAQAAKGTDALAVTGTLAGAAVSAGDTLAHSDGTRYKITESVTIGAATVNVSIEAITKGVIGNKLTGDTMDFESAPANINTTATLVSDLSDGFDVETDAELLERVQHAYKNPPAGGRFSDYWGWARAVDGVGQAYCYGPSSYALSGRRGVGIVDVAVLAPGTGIAKSPSATLRQAVQDAIDDNRPVHAKPGKVLLIDPIATDIDIQVTPREGYEFDWSGTLTVSSYASKVITVSAAIPQDIQNLVDAGGTARLMLKGQLMVVEAYSSPGGGPYTMTVRDTPSPVPAGSDTVYPGGPVTAGALAAVKTYMDTLGPARGAAADPDQAWDDSCRPSQLAASLLERRLSDGSTVGVTGCKEITVNTPSSVTTPGDAGGETGPVEWLYYNQITVRP